MLDGVQDGVLGYLVEDNALRMFGLQPQHLVQMPSDGFPLAVLIGGQPHGLGLSRLALQFAHQLALVRRYLVVRRKVVGYVDAELFLLQVAYVPVAGKDFVILAKEFLNGFSFCR